jgi:hypothetical protein
VYMCMCVRVCICICVCVCVYVYVYVCVYMYMCMCVYMYMCMWVCVCATQIPSVVTFRKAVFYISYGLLCFLSLTRVPSETQQGAVSHHTNCYCNILIQILLILFRTPFQLPDITHCSATRRCLWPALTNCQPLHCK